MNDREASGEGCWITEQLIRQASPSQLQQVLVGELDRGVRIFHVKPSDVKWSEMVPYDPARAMECYGTLALGEDGYEVGVAGFWHRRYDEQHRTLHRLEDELEKVRREYRQLQELSGQALVRSHLLRGDRELGAAKLAEELDAARTALWMALNSCREESERADRNLRFAIEAERRAPE